MQRRIAASPLLHTAGEMSGLPRTAQTAYHRWQPPAVACKTLGPTKANATCSQSDWRAQFACLEREPAPLLAVSERGHRQCHGTADDPCSNPVPQNPAHRAFFLSVCPPRRSRSGAPWTHKTVIEIISGSSKGVAAVSFLVARYDRRGAYQRQSRRAE